MTLVLVMVLIPTAVCYYFFFDGVYGLAAGAVLFGASAVVGWFLKKRGYLRGDLAVQTDKITNKTSDDPRHMARWVP